jgi:hypothetical protein
MTKVVTLEQVLELAKQLSLVDKINGSVSDLL